jgi:nicotinate phosphoribosyltransferase
MYPPKTMHEQIIESGSRPDNPWPLSTDLYQLTMAQAYLLTGMADRRSIFHMFFRTAPFAGRYAVAAGIGPFADWLERLHFSADHIDYLASLTGADSRGLFHPDFLDYLRRWRFRGAIEAVDEGEVIFPYEPMLRVRAPLLDGQLIETGMLTMVNHQSLIATKASRMRMAVGSDELMEFGLRRAHGMDGGLSASRAAFIGGVDATSNVLAGRCYQIPVRGTHAHSWVMSFADEQRAFDAYASVFPHNAVLLVDTFNSLEGVRHAIITGHTLRARGSDLLGIRLDSGDLAYLAKQARAMLDEAGFADTKIIASSDLDERLITSLKLQGAPIDAWGVGTKLVTAYDDPSLGGVYKLAAVEKEVGELVECLKLSDQAAKTSIPGCLDVARLSIDNHCTGDVIFDTFTEPLPGSDETVITIISPVDPWKRKVVPRKNLDRQTLLTPLFADGVRVKEAPRLARIRARTQENLRRFDPAIFRFDNPHAYAAGLSHRLHERREAMKAHEFELIKAHLASQHENGNNHKEQKSDP